MNISFRLESDRYAKTNIISGYYGHLRERGGASRPSTFNFSFKKNKLITTFGEGLFFPGLISFGG